jgi:hypothetical protein
MHRDDQALTSSQVSHITAPLLVPRDLVEFSDPVYVKAEMTILVDSWVEAALTVCAAPTQHITSQ